MQRNQIVLAILKGKYLGKMLIIYDDEKIYPFIWEK